MSWFKKLFQVFKSEEDDYIDEARFEEQHHVHRSSKKENRDVDAKVLYQYPKGQFRFPLIPDEKEEPRPRRQDKRMAQKETTEPIRTRRSQHEKVVSVPKKVEKSSTSKKSYSNRAFRPTEIPSPIYGYDRQPKNPNPIEFELEDFSGSKAEKQLEAVTGNKLSSEKINGLKKKPFDDYGDKELVLEKVETDGKFSVLKEREDKREEDSPSSPPIIDSETPQPISEPFLEALVHDGPKGTGDGTEIRGNLEREEIYKEADDEGMEEIVSETESPTETTPVSVKELEEEPEVGQELKREVELELSRKIEQVSELEAEVVLDVEPEPKPESESEPKLELEPESEPEDEPEQEPKLESESEPKLELEPESELEDEPEQEPKLESESEPELEVEQETELELEPKQELEPESDLELEAELEPEPEKRRSHIPFNVIMLKEDRRKLQERTMAQLAPLLSRAEVSATVEEVKQEPDQKQEQDPEVELEQDVEEPYYVFPSLDLLNPPVFKSADAEWLQLQEEQLNETLFHFNVRASVANVTQGPSVTRFEVHPEPGVKVNKITNLADDIKLSLAAKDIRMEAPIPGTHLIGIEVPNKSSRPVLISEILTTEEFSTSPSPLTAVLGLDISGKPIVTDLRKMPHGLIAGATGSGKSVCINSILVSLLYKANPNEVKLLLIDPKMVELAPYNQIPHLVSPVITDVKAATAALKWAVEEMERRYELFAHAGVREITRFNDIAEQEKNYAVKLPYIVIVIDELADLMMMSPADVEEAICRIAQKARACGIHLIIATQRPSVDVITGLIKANVPTRIAFSVSSQIDSRTIIDISGAERLLGRGDMLFLENGSSKPVRLQGTFVSDEEIDAIVAHVRREQSPQYLFEQEELLKKSVVTEEEDELFYEACEYIIEQGGASTSSLQRKFKIGYNRAARLIDMMEEQGFISEAKGSKPRDVLITELELESIHEQ